MQTSLERVVKSFPEVDRIFAKLGTAEVATDPMPPSVADNFVIMKDRERLARPRKPKAQLVAEMEAAVRQSRATTTSSRSRSRCASTS